MYCILSIKILGCAVLLLNKPNLFPHFEKLCPFRCKKKLNTIIKGKK
jgi:hypothetical protein